MGKTPKDRENWPILEGAFVRVDNGAGRIRNGIVTHAEWAAVEFVENDGRLGHARPQHVKVVKPPKCKDAFDEVKVKALRLLAEKRIEDRRNPREAVKSVKRSVL